MFTEKKAARRWAFRTHHLILHLCCTPCPPSLGVLLPPHIGERIGLTLVSICHWSLQTGLQTVWFHVSRRMAIFANSNLAFLSETYLQGRSNFWPAPVITELRREHKDHQSFRTKQLRRGTGAPYVQLQIKLQVSHLLQKAWHCIPTALCAVVVPSTRLLMKDANGIRWVEIKKQMWSNTERIWLFWLLSHPPFSDQQPTSMEDDTLFCLLVCGQKQVSCLVSACSSYSWRTWGLS